jgi:hypothetical protein
MKIVYSWYKKNGSLGARFIWVEGGKFIRSTIQGENEALFKGRLGLEFLDWFETDVAAGRLVKAVYRPGEWIHSVYDCKSCIG